MFSENQKLIKTLNKEKPVYETEELPNARKRFGNFLFGHWRAIAFVVGIVAFAGITLATTGAAALVGAIINLNYTVINVLLVWAGLLLGSGLIFGKHRREALHENKMVRMQNKVKRNEKKFEKYLQLYKGQLLIGNRELERCKSADPKHKARFARVAYREYKRHRNSMNYYMDRMLHIARNTQSITDAKMPKVLNKMEFHEDKYARVRTDAQYGMYQMMNGMNQVVPQTKTFDTDISKQLSSRDILNRTIAKMQEKRGDKASYDFALYRPEKNQKRFNKFDKMRRNYVPMDVDSYEANMSTKNGISREQAFPDSTLNDELKAERVAVKPKSKATKNSNQVENENKQAVIVPEVQTIKSPVIDVVPETIVTKEVAKTSTSSEPLKEAKPRLRSGIYVDGVIKTGAHNYKVSEKNDEILEATNNRMVAEQVHSVRVKFSVDHGKADIKVIDFSKEPKDPVQ